MQRASSEIPTTLRGAIVTITGICATVSRDDLKAALTAAGAVVTGSVNKHTTLLVAGERGAGTKLEKAKELGVPVMPSSAIADLLVKEGLLEKDRRFPPYEDPFPPVVATEQAIANVMMMVMLQLGLDELKIDNMTRAKVLAGHYMVSLERNGVENCDVLKLIKLGGDDAAM